MQRETHSRETFSDELLNATPGHDVNFTFDQAQIDENTQGEITMSARMVLSPKGYETDSTIGEFRIASEIESS